MTRLNLLTFADGLMWDSITNEPISIARIVNVHRTANCFFATAPRSMALKATETLYTMTKQSYLNSVPSHPRPDSCVYVPDIQDSFTIFLISRYCMLEICVEQQYIRAHAHSQTCVRSCCVALNT